MTSVQELCQEAGLKIVVSIGIVHFLKDQACEEPGIKRKEMYSLIHFLNTTSFSLYYQ